MELNEQALKEAKFSKSQIKSLSKAFWNLVEKYHLSNADLHAVLGKNFDLKTLKKYKMAMTLPDGESDILLRVIHMLHIHSSLRIIYPHNPSIVYSWIKTKTPEFDNKSPLQILSNSGHNSFMVLMGLRNYLDHKRGIT